jgi:membrane-bound metal-dependent hydrolase YbcI (DUF457 family)
MLGVTGCAAFGLERKYGWQILAMAAVAAVSPDWDGLTLLFGPQLFDTAHRVWGHNVVVCAIVGALIAAVDYRYDVSTRFGRWFVTTLRVQPPPEFQVRSQFTVRDLCVWVAVGVVAAGSHLIADMVVSGSATLTDWKVQLLWPFSQEGWVYPMIPWGDVGATIVFVIGMFAMLRWKSRSRETAWLTLAGVLAYLIVRRTMNA